MGFLERRSFDLYFRIKRVSWKMHIYNLKYESLVTIQIKAKWISLKCKVNSITLPQLTEWSCGQPFYIIILYTSNNPIIYLTLSTLRSLFQAIWPSSIIIAVYHVFRSMSKWITSKWCVLSQWIFGRIYLFIYLFIIFCQGSPFTNK